MRKSCMAAHPKVKELMQRFSEHAYASYMQGTPALSHLPLLLKYNVASGLARNADLLGVTAQYYDWYGISPLNKQGPLLGSGAGAEWPACLQPTELQSSIEHHPWLDLFPWPKVRDNMLQAFQRTEPVDYEDELCIDVCEYNHLDRRPILIVWGPPEDHRSWEIDPIFLEKCTKPQTTGAEHEARSRLLHSSGITRYRGVCQTSSANGLTTRVSAECGWKWAMHA